MTKKERETIHEHFRHYRALETMHRDQKEAMIAGEPESYPGDLETKTRLTAENAAARQAIGDLMLMLGVRFPTTQEVKA